jgi:DNA-binding transcriptional LysR family regulator
MAATSRGRCRRALKDAEQQLGFMLFASVRGRLQATRETLELQAEIAHVYEALEPVQRLASRLRHHHAPTLRALCTPPLANQLLPQSIAVLRRRFRTRHATCRASRRGKSSGACCCMRRTWA